MSNWRLKSEMPVGEWVEVMSSLSLAFPRIKKLHENGMLEDSKVGFEWAGEVFYWRPIDE